MGISFVIPVYKNRSTLVELHRLLSGVMQTMNQPYEIIFVNDACPQGSAEILEELKAVDERVKIITHADNRGQHAAILNGLSVATHDIIVTMDADLQDDPSFIYKLIEPLESADVVFAAKSGAYESAFRLFTSRLFKLALSLATGGRLPVRSSLFMALRSEVCSRLLSFAPMEPHLLALMGVDGFRMTTVDYVRPPRAGDSAYTARTRLKTAIHAFKTILIYRTSAFNVSSAAFFLSTFSVL